MSKSVKLKDNTYLDSTGVAHNREKLSTVISNILSKITPVSLYSNSTGTSGSITLSQSVNNFSYVEIIYRYNSNNGCKSIKLYVPNGTVALLDASYDNGTYLYVNTDTVTISGTSLTRSNQIRWRIAVSGGNSTRTTNATNLLITRVIGYK